MGHTAAAAAAALISCATFDNEQHNIGDTVECIEFYLFISKNGFTERNHRRSRIERSGDSGSIFGVLWEHFDYYAVAYSKFNWFSEIDPFIICLIYSKINVPNWKSPHRSKYRWLQLEDNNPFIQR